jgi:hypothetical protein
MIIHENRDSVAIATFKTSNRKTGDMVQVWILDPSMNPVQSVKTGRDAKTVCKGCPFASGKGCYVNVGQAPLSVWKAYKRGSYGRMDPKDYSKYFGGRKVRFGAYGNPSLIPLSIVKAIANASDGWTGYFHDWRDMPKAKRIGYSQYFMASTETESSRRLAEALELRYFHVSPEKPIGAIECLSDSKGMECSRCKLCSGLSKPRSPSIWINPHGSKKTKAIDAANN